MLWDLPEWIPPATRTLVVAAHPDDETLGAGGFIATQSARGLEITVAAVTDGEQAYPEHTQLAEVRRNEQTEALSRLGVSADKIVRFGMPDNGVTEREDELAERLEAMVTRDTLVVAPWRGDFHPDHQACGRAAEKVARKAGAMLSTYFFWAWHMVRAERFANLRLRSLPLHGGSLEAKAEAVRLHRSQFEREKGDPILNEKLLSPAKRLFEIFSIA